MKPYERLVTINDQWAKVGSERQIIDSKSRYYGGVIDPFTGVPWPSHTNTPFVMSIWAASIANPDSAYYRNEMLTARLETASRFMLHYQHTDGTISPGWTNYHSPPDTGFVIVGLAQLLQVIEADGWSEFKPIAENLMLFLRRTIPAMLTGGSHTPNHRWVMAAALGFLYRLFELEDLKLRAEEWLAEGLDYTSDGEWTERSNGIYNTVSDVMLYHTAKLFGRPELLEPVRLNLRMMMYMVHPDGEIVTDYSGRQDYGQKSSLAEYYLPYRLMAEEDRDPQFSAMALRAEEALLQPEVNWSTAMIGHLLHPEWREGGIAPASLTKAYRQLINGDYPRSAYMKERIRRGLSAAPGHSKLHFEFGAPVARYLNDRTSVTVMSESSSFFSLRHGQIKLLGVQIASSFGPGSVVMQRLTEKEGTYFLQGVEEKGYYGPIPQEVLPAESASGIAPWYLLPHEARPLTHAQRQTIHVQVEETDEGWEIRLVSEGPADVLTQIVFLLGEEGSVLLNYDEIPKERSVLWERGSLRYEVGGDWMELTGGACEHQAEALRNTNYPSGCRLVIANLITPFEHAFAIRLSNDNLPSIDRLQE